MAAGLGTAAAGVAGGGKPKPVKPPRTAAGKLLSATGDTTGVVRLLARRDGKVEVHVAVAGMTPGFHGFHVHTTGVCDPAATGPGGTPSPFASAGGHFTPAPAVHGSHAGDMPPLLVGADGTGAARFLTDRFALGDLMDADGSAVIVHAGPDNLANIPGRYHSHDPDATSTTFGPDAATLATGDAGARAACGVVTAKKGGKRGR
jgi:Cu-Zn family superoxide dismutase